MSRTRPWGPPARVKVAVEFKVRLLVEADCLPQALDAAAATISGPKAAAVDGSARIVRQTPKWWTRSRPLQVESLERMARDGEP